MRRHIMKMLEPIFGLETTRVKLEELAKIVMFLRKDIGTLETNQGIAASTSRILSTLSHRLDTYQQDTVRTTNRQEADIQEIRHNLSHIHTAITEAIGTPKKPGWLMAQMSQTDEYIKGKLSFLSTRIDVLSKKIYDFEAAQVEPEAARLAIFKCEQCGVPCSLEWKRSVQNINPPPPEHCPYDGSRAEWKRV